MIKASNTILFKSADETYLDVEWVGDYLEATTGATGNLPNYIGSPDYIIPKDIPANAGIQELLNKISVFFKITTNKEYNIICSDDPINIMVYHAQHENTYYEQPTHKFLKQTSFSYHDTLIFTNEQFKDLSKLPDEIQKIKWTGKPSQDDLDIKISGQRVDLGQKAIGAMLIVYTIKSDVYIVNTHAADTLGGFWFPTIYEPRVYGIFANDGSIAASLKLDPPKSYV